MERGRRRYITHHLCYHSLTNCLYFPHITIDSYTTGCPVKDLQQVDGLGMTRGNDIREVSGSEQKVRNWLPVTWPL
jgi:hypothetical protein